MVTSPSSLNPPTNRRSISVDDYQPVTRSPQVSSSSESDNDENDPAAVPAPLPPRAKKKKKKKKLRKSNSSISLDSLDRDDLVDDIPVNHTARQSLPPPKTTPQASAQPPAQARAQAQLQAQPRVQQLPQQNTAKASPPKKPRAEQPLDQASNTAARASANNAAHPPASGTPVTNTPEMEPDEPITDDNLVNVAALPSTDDFGWDRFIFFSHRSQRHFFPEDSYLSQFSPFASVASSMSGLTTRSVCAVCGAGGTLHDCIRCPLAFHAPCVDPMKTTVFSSTWMCPACMAAKNGDTGPDWYPAPNILMRPLPDPSSGMKRLIADVREGNPIDMVFTPSLFNYYKSIAGSDWLRCTRCRRIRIVREGVLSEAVRIPFDCSLAFWIDADDRRCDPPGEQKLYGRAEQRVVQYLRSRKTQRQLLFRFGFDEVDAKDYGKADMQNLPKLQPLKSAQPRLKPPSVTPMEISPITSPKALPQRPSQPRVEQNIIEELLKLSAPMEANSKRKGTAPRQVVPPTVQQRQPAAQQMPSTAPQMPTAAPQIPTAAPQIPTAAPQIPTAAPRMPTVKQRVPTAAQQMPSATQQMPPVVQRMEPTLQQVQPAAQQAQPQLTSANATPQLSTAQPTVRAQTPASQTAQVSPVMVSPPSQPSTLTVPKTEPVENGQNNQQDLLAFIALLDWEEWIEDELTDLALASNKQLTQLYVALRATPEKFKRQAIRLVNRLKDGTRSQQTHATTQGQSQTPPPSQAPPQPQAVLQPPLQPQLQAQIAQQLQQQMQPQLQTQTQAMQMQMGTQQVPMQVTQAAMQRQAAMPQRGPQQNFDTIFRQMAIKHVRDIQDLEQHFMRKMEQVPASQVAEVMALKDVTIANMKTRQQQEIRTFYQTHGMR